ncbi:transport system permease protein, partial [Streptomyces clavuligerus]
KKENRTTKSKKKHKKKKKQKEKKKKTTQNLPHHRGRGTNAPGPARGGRRGRTNSRRLRPPGPGAHRLADPFLLGISSGASTGAVLVLTLGIGVTTAVAMPVGAFLGALGALVLVYALASRGGGMTGTRLVLAGVTVSYILTALTTLVLVASARPEHFREALYWSLGGLGSARWDTVWLPAAVTCAALPLLFALSRPLDLMLVGEESATVLGLDVARFRAAVFVLASLITAVLVAASGAVGFIGLMVPHAARLLVGATHRALLPVSALAGAAALIVADLAARTVASPQDIPVGVLTALIGGPLFLWLMRSRTAQGAAL